AINEMYQMKTAKKSYDTSGKTSSIEKWKSTDFGIKLDYLGMHGAGISYSFSKSDLEWGTNSGDFVQSETGIYYLWNNVIGGVDLHDLTFKLTKIKSGIFSRTGKLEENGVEGETYSALTLRAAIDFIISDKIISTNLFETNIEDDDYISNVQIASKIIYDVSEKTSAAIEFNRIDIASSADQYENSLKLYGSYQFSDIQWGNLNFDFKIVPFYSHSLSGKNYFKTSSMGVQLHTYFK
ncbi:MAG: hypothetical protein CMG09_03650, partial [Candidatus Marinimicrobia bacterium]|nr:hypothetical protein [Candidatus Neomarinimicrobiota bacterium]